MKTITLLLLALIGLTAMAIQNANAGAAVATDTLGNMATAYGGPVQREKQRALAEASRRYGPNVRILASTDIPGRWRDCCCASSKWAQLARGGCARHAVGY